MTTSTTSADSMTSKIYFWQDVFEMFVMHNLKDYYLFSTMCASMIKLANNGNGLQNADLERLIKYTWDQYLGWPSDHVPTLIVNDPFFLKLVIPSTVNDNQDDIKALKHIYLMGWNQDFKELVKSHPRFDQWVFLFQKVRWKHDNLKDFVSFLFSDPNFSDSDKKMAIVELETISNDLRFLFHRKLVTLPKLNQVIDYFKGQIKESDFPAATTYMSNASKYEHLKKYYLFLVVTIFSNFKLMLESFQTTK